MEQMNQFRWAQEHIDNLSNQDADSRHAMQQRMRALQNNIDELERKPPKEHVAIHVFSGENRAQRRERERKERRAAKKER